MSQFSDRLMFFRKYEERFSGGHGGVTGTVMGVLFLGTLTNLLLIAGVNSFWQGTASGVVLITAVALDRTRRD